MAIAPSKLGQFILRESGSDDLLLHKLRTVGLMKPRASDDKLLAVFSRARHEHETLPEGTRTFNSPHERVRMFLGPYLSKKGRKWAVPLESLNLPDEDLTDKSRPWWKFWG